MATPPPLLMKTMTNVHRAVLKLSGGRLGWTMGKMPAIELTTTGRKTGQRRSTMLTVPWEEGDKRAIVASAGGMDAHPAWYLNLDADPNVIVRTADGETPMTARTTAGTERAELWAAITEKYANYAEYQTKTDREIPVVVLEPTT